MKQEHIKILSRIFHILSRFGFISLLIFLPFEEADALYKLSLVIVFIGVTGKSWLNTNNTAKFRALHKTGILFALGLIASFTIRNLSPIIGNINNINSGEVWFFSVIWSFFKSGIFLIFSYFLISEEYRLSLTEGKDLTQFRFLRVLLSVIFSILVLSCFASLFPETSFKYFWREMGLYIWLALAVWKEIDSFKELNFIISIGAVVAIIVGVIGVGEFFLFKFGAEPVRNFILSHEMVKAETYIHIQFPFAHHNRMASYCMLGTLLCIFQILLAKPGYKRILILALSLFPFLALVLTLNRGAFIAFALSFCIIIILRRPKRLMLFPVFLLIVFILLPSVSKERFASILNKDTYTESRGTFYLRKVAWVAAVKIIRDHPILGIGFSYKNHVKVYYLYTKEDIEEKTHCHNNYLEVAVETGIVNALLFIIFIVNLYIGLARRWKSLKMHKLPVNYSVCFITILSGIVIYGFINYSLRYSIGTYIFILFGIILAYLKMTEPITEEAEQTTRPL